mgnify:CR=1 FL=1
MKLAAISGVNGPFTDAEKAVIAYAGEVALTNAAGRMTPELHARLRRHFSDADLLELGTVMAIISGMAKLSFVLGLVERVTDLDPARGGQLVGGDALPDVVVQDLRGGPGHGSEPGVGQATRQPLDPPPVRRVERRGGLVHQHHLRLHGQIGRAHV